MSADIQTIKADLEIFAQAKENNYGDLGKEFDKRKSKIEYFRNLTQEDVEGFDRTEVWNMFLKLWAINPLLKGKLMSNELNDLKMFIIDAINKKPINEENIRPSLIGIGATALTEIHSIYSPEDYITINKVTLTVLRHYGYNVVKHSSNLSWKNYCKIMECCNDLRNIMSSSGTMECDFLDADDFIYFISQSKLGKNSSSANITDTDEPIIRTDGAWFIDTCFIDEDVQSILESTSWEHRFQDPAYTDAFRYMKSGERIVLKTSDVVKNTDEFENYGISVPVMEIISVGTVAECSEDGLIKVNWDRDYVSPGRWYLYSFRKMIWNVRRDEENWMQGALLDFVFNGIEQDIDMFLQDEMFENKYREPRDNLNDPSDSAFQHNKLFDDYNKESFLKEVFISEEDYRRLCNILERKKNLILQGPPGVGKTFCAKRLAYSILGCKDDSHICSIQFHQSYSYEEFIMGYAPNKDGFELKDGVFYKFCEKARSNTEEKYFFIIDEINRGNLSKIMGELMVLLEADKRVTESMELAYSGDDGPIMFTVPDNLYIIGMMNTADRSIEDVDVALRRRFAFYRFDPAFDSPNFRKQLLALSDDAAKVDEVIRRMNAINKKIADDVQLGRGYCIGHSYFCTQKDSDDFVFDDWYNDVLEYEIEPLLEEYWYDDPDKVKDCMKSLSEEFVA